MLLKHLENFTGVTVLVVGDVMLDRYWWGQAHRISPEAPVPVVRLQQQTSAAGGAGNVAVNVAGLGAQPKLLGVIGEDEAGRELRTLLQAQGVDASHCLNLPTRPTTVKTRVVAQGQHIVRLDQEDTSPIDGTLAQELVAQVEMLLATVDVLVLSDYAKGILTPEVLAQVIPLAQQNGVPVLVDPKGRDYRRYDGATLLTPNRNEAMHASGIEDPPNPAAVEQAGQALLRQTKVAAILVTQGEDGMTLFQHQQEPTHLAARARAVYDVTGAGDTVIATLATALGAGAGLLDAAQIANIAAGLVVEQIGTTPITQAQLWAACISHYDGIR